MSENLPKSLKHKDFEIRPNPVRVIVEKKEKWNTQFEIWEHKGSESIVFPYSGKETYNSKDDAIKHCFNAGRYIIDNKPEQLIKN